ncbi:VOC family protein [Lacticaseibacillus brantae]|uniref:VOC domain-containing protein n=1 Tax=Lacticaseibacillus brantae DSM 23927 TaxID=1423727 RepID=A0A0R2AXQ2_9LACO|nr:VOC family protein [Lacticaseibacillus brantae]KRM72161.1 hypothetical protein FC34_GL001145 [Lacticaseibacillus brantae DSM 23927]
MQIEHIGLWVNDLDTISAFYMQYFDATRNERYHNATTGFSSYFLSFSDGARLEIMTNDAGITTAIPNTGYAHLAFAVGTAADVDQLVQRLTADGITLVNGPRTTGDSYYEAVIEDPEGNLIELTTN